MKRKTAKEILVESFLELSAVQPVDKITVIDITENCGYSTTTFYRHFKDKYDLMVWEHTRQVDEIMQAFDKVNHDWMQTCLDAARFFYGQKEYLKNLLLHTGGFDSFVWNMQTIHFESLKRWILGEFGKEELDIKTEMYLRIYCQGAVDLACDWILGKYDVTPEEMAEVYVNCMPVPLQKYLCTEQNGTNLT